MTYDQYGDTSVLKLTDQPMPKVGPSEIRIRVTAASVNPVDWKLMAGGLDPMLESDFPVIPGWDVTGVVESVGPDTPEFSEGDRVAAYARKQVNSDGTFAQYVTVLAEAAAKVPDEVDDDVAAALPLTGLTAQRTLRTLELTADDTLLIHAASGGVGYMAAQLARSIGATVVGTASPANHAKLEALGVTPVAYGEGLTQRLKEVAPEGFTAVADFVGGVGEVTQAVVREGARVASIADPEVLETGGSWVWVRPDGAGLAQLLEDVRSGALTVAVERTYPLEKLAEAFEANQNGEVSGKIVIRIDD